MVAAEILVRIFASGAKLSECFLELRSGFLHKLKFVTCMTTDDTISTNEVITIKTVDLQRLIVVFAH